MENWKKNLYSSIICISLVVGISLFLIINSLINAPEYAFDFISRALIVMLIFLSLGIPQIIYALKHKEDKYFFPKGIMVINRKTIDKLIQEHLIKGLGLQEHPYEFNFNERISLSKIIIKKINFYFKIAYQNLPSLIIADCENFLITDNHILLLDLISCSRFTITNNIIKRFGYNTKCRDLLIENNGIER